jgi:hypothetical protein
VINSRRDHRSIKRLLKMESFKITDLGLEEEGYRTWCYEVDSVVGTSYILQTGEVVVQFDAVIVIISPHSLSSNQVTKEVVRAHESARNFLPILHGISHVEF